MNNRERLQRRIDALSPEQQHVFAARLRDKESRSIPRVARDAIVPAAPNQKSLWIIDQLQANAAYNEAVTVRLGGHLDIDILTSAIQYIIGQHDALRMSFLEKDGQVFVHVAEHLPLTLEQPSFVGPEAETQAILWLEEMIRRHFVLSAAPLFRFALVKLANDDHILCFVIHHGICDAASNLFLLNELCELYSFGQSGRQIRLPEPELGFIDWVAHSDQRIREEYLAFWRTQLAESKALRLPTLDARGIRSRASGGHVRFHLDDKVATAVHRFAEAGATTPFAVLLTAYAAVLQRYSGQTSLVIGIPTSGRSSLVASMVGFFVNMLPLRLTVDEEKSFLANLRVIGTEVIVALEHELPLPSIIETVHPERNQSGTPLFQVAFSYVTSTKNLEKMGDLQIELLDVASDIPKYDLTFYVTAGASQFECDLEFADESERAMAEQLASHVQSLLMAVIRRQDISLHDVSMLMPGEAELLTQQCNQTKLPFRDHLTLDQLFVERCAAQPGAIAVADGHRTLTYEMLGQRVDAIAEKLLALGVGRGQHVAVFMERCCDLAAAVLAILKCGAAYVPFEPGTPPLRLVHIAKLAQPVAVLTDATLAQVCPEIFAAGTQAIVLGTSFNVPTDVHLSWHTDPGAFPQTSLSSQSRADDIAYVIFTSGTTGVPKGVVVRHRPVINVIEWVNRTFTIQPGDKLLMVSSISFDLSVYDIFGGFAAGATVRVARQDEISNPTTLARLVFEEQITFWNSAPAALAQVQPFFEIEAPRYQMRMLRLVFLSGDWIPLGLPTQLHNIFPSVKAVALGGATEAAIWSNYYIIDEVRPEWVSIPYGRPIQNACYYILDEYLHPCPVGVPGDLFIGGECLADGYLGNLELTAERFVTNPFLGPGARMYCTGDRARRWLDGNLEFLGRRDGQVKLRGYRVEIADVEATIRNHPSVEAAVVVDLERGFHEKSLIAGLVLRSGGVAELRADLARRLPSYMVPEQLITFAALPLTSNGKVDRDTIRRQARTQLLTPPTGKLPQNTLEAEVEILFSEILAWSVLFTDQSFFTLGGNSLSAARLLALARTRFVVELSLADFFIDPTVSGLAQMITQGRRSPSPLAQDDADAENADQTVAFGQERMWFHQHLNPQSAIYNVPLTIWLLGQVDPSTLVVALNMVVMRHVPLRTLYEERDNHPYPLVEKEAQVPWRYHEAKSRSEAERLAEAFIREPFDLKLNLPIRAALILVGPTEQLLALSLHHIACDGWSLEILMSELSASLRSEKLLPLRSTYTDFVTAEHKWLNGQGGLDALVFWREELQDAPSLLTLPLDEARAPVQSGQGEVLIDRIEPEVVAALETLAHQSNATLFEVLLTAYASLLARLSGQYDLVIGMPVANRANETSHDLIGYFSNTVPIRLRLAPDLSTVERIAIASNASRRSQAHEAFPFERLVELLNPRRDPSYQPIFQVTINYEVSAGQLNLGKIRAETAVISTNTTKRDLTLVFYHSAEGLTFSIEYDTQLFRHDTVQSWLEALLRTLRRFAFGEETTTMKKTINVQSWSSQRQFDISQMLRQTLHTTSTGLRHRGVTLPWSQVWSQAFGIQAALQHAGVHAHDRIALLSERSSLAIAAILGVLDAHIAYIPLDPAQPLERLQHAVRRAGTSAVLCTPTLSDMASKLGVPVINIEQAESSPTEPLEEEPDIIAYCMQTSGSTGEPKVVALVRSGLAEYLDALSRALPINRRDIYLHTAALSFSSSVRQLLFPLSQSAHVVLADTTDLQDPSALLQLLRSEEVTIWDVIPSVFAIVIRFLEEMTPAERACSLPGHLRRILSASEPLPIELVQRWRAVASKEIAIVNMYGQTETTGIVSIYPVPLETTGDGPVPIGFALPHIEVFLARDGQRVEGGEIGEICVAGSAVGTGYQGESTSDARFELSGGRRMYHTHDFGRMRHDGAIEYLGREDLQVKVRGIRVDLSELERALHRHPQVETAVAILRRDVGSDGVLVAYVSPKGQVSIDSAECRRFLRERLPEYLVPSFVVVLDALPRTTSGKIDRTALPRPRMPFELDRPADALEILVLTAFADVLGLPESEVSVTNDFFALGGHSLLVAQLATRVSSFAEIRIHPSLIFRHTTPRALAQVIQQKRQYANVPAIPKISRDRPLRASFAQERLWLLAKLEQQSAAYNVQRIFRLLGPLDIQALQAALSLIQTRHEVLRTRLFQSDDGALYQQNVPEVALPFEYLVLHASDATGRREEVYQHAREIMRQPVSLESAPLWRLSLAPIGHAEHWLTVTAHHLALDDLSYGILLRELHEAYSAFTEGRETHLATLVVQVADLAEFERAWLASQEGQHELTYWREQLSTQAPYTLLPRESAFATGDSRGAIHRFQVPRTVVERLKTLARRHGATLSMVILAGFDLVLSRLTGLDTVVIGTSVSSRGFPETHNLIGFFINTLALRVDLSGNPTFTELLKRVRETCLGAYRHQSVPFEQVIAELNPKRHQDRPPLFEVLTNFLHEGTGEATIGPLTVEEDGIDELDSKFTLTLSMRETSAGIECAFVRRITSLSARQVEAWSMQLVSILEQVAERPDLLISSLELRDISTIELRQLLSTPLPTTLFVPVITALEDVVKRQADDIAILDGEHLISYGQLWRATGLVASWLADAKIEPGVHVAVIGPRGSLSVAALIGVMRAGCVVVPIDRDLPTRRIEHMLARVDAAHVLVVGEGPAMENWQTIPNDLFLLDGPAITREAPYGHAYVYFTSGSTGDAKAILGTHQGLSHYIHWHRKHFQIYTHDRHSQIPTLSFDAALRDIFAALTAGASLHIPQREERENSFATLAWIERHQLTHVHTTPSILQSWLAAPGAPEITLTSLRYLSLAGEPLDGSLAKHWWQRFPSSPCQITNLYGPTETTIIKSAYHVERAVENGLLPIGTPISETQLAVLNQSGNLCGIGECGEIVIRTAFRTLGYLHAEGEANGFVPNPFTDDPSDLLYHTGDVGRQRSDGNFEVLGRMDQQVKIRGVRIQPLEVELALSTHPSVARCAVVAAHDVLGSSDLHAYVVTEGTTPSTLELRRYLEQLLPGPMIPSRFFFVLTLPLTITGKVDRNSLKDLQKVEIISQPPATPFTPQEALVASIWREVLGVDVPHRDVSFFELGGHSLLATQIIARLYTQSGIRVPLKILFELPTLAAFCQHLATLTPQAVTPHQPRPERILLTIAQRLYWNLHFLSPDDLALRLIRVCQIGEAPDIELLRNRWTTLTERADALRLTFQVENEQVWQSTSSAIAAIQCVELGPEESVEQAMQHATATPRLAHGEALARITVVHHANKWTLILCLHHIIGDAYSAEWLMHFLQGTASEARLSSFLDWAWQNTLTPEVQQVESARVQQLADLPGARLIHLASAGDSHTAAVEVESILSQEMTDSLIEICHEYGLTLFQWTLALLAESLHATGHLLHALVVAVHVGGRSTDDEQATIGLLSRTVLVPIEQAISPLEATMQAAQAWLQVIEHPACLEMLELGTAGVAVTAGWQNAPLTGREEVKESTHGSFMLNVSARMDEHHLCTRFAFRKGCLTETAIKQFTSVYQHLSQFAASTPKDIWPVLHNKIEEN